MDGISIYTVYIEVHGLGLEPYYVTKKFSSKQEAIDFFENEGYTQLLENMYAKLDDAYIKCIASIRRDKWNWQY